MEARNRSVFQPLSKSKTDESPRFECCLLRLWWMEIPRAGRGRAAEGNVSRGTGQAGRTKDKANVRPIKDPAEEPLDHQGLPANLDAERWILAGLLEDVALYAQASSFRLEPDSFSLERHTRIFRAMRNLMECEEHINLAIVAEELVRLGELGTDGLGYLVDLENGMPRLTVESFGSFVRIGLEKSVRRRGIYLAQKRKAEFAVSTASPEEILGSHTRMVRDIEILSARGWRMPSASSSNGRPPTPERTRQVMMAAPDGWQRPGGMR